jgi:hypothetical protein
MRRLKGDELRRFAGRSPTSKPELVEAIGKLQTLRPAATHINAAYLRPDAPVRQGSKRYSEGRSPIHGSAAHP